MDQQAPTKALQNNDDDLPDAERAFDICSRLATPFRDEADNIHLEIGDDENKSSWPIQDRRIRAWIAERFQNATHRLIADRDIVKVLRVFEGKAWATVARPLVATSNWPHIEANPVAYALVIFANQRGPWEGPTRELLTQLNSSKIRRRLPQRLHSDMPKVVQSLSRRINAIKPLLKAVGLTVELMHKEDGSHFKLVVDADFVREPDGTSVRSSANASDASPHVFTSFDSADGPEGLRDRDRLHQQLQLIIGGHADDATAH